jgi:hypothetical protein
VALVAALSAGSVLGCVDPNKDFQDYVTLAADKRAQSETGGAGGDGGAGGGANVGALDGQFISYCLSSLGAGDPAKSLLLATELKQDGTSLSVTLTPLLIAATSLKDTLGSPVNAKAEVANNAFSINFGSVMIPGAANAISGSDIQIDNTVFAAKIQSTDHLCAELGGQLVKPFAYPLDDPGDICIILRVNADGSLPPRPDAKGFVCP